MQSSVYISAPPLSASGPLALVALAMALFVTTASLAQLHYLFVQMRKRPMALFQSIWFCYCAYFSYGHRTSQTLTNGQSAHFSLQWLLCAWRNPNLRRSYQRSNVSVDFFEFLFTKFAACSKPPSRDNHHKSLYPRTQ